MTELIERSVLFGNPERTAPVLSPDGTLIAYTAPLGGVLNLFVGPADGDGGKPVTGELERAVRSYLWSEDQSYLLYLQDRGGDENFTLMGVELATGDTHDLTPFGGVQVRILKTSRRRPSELALAINHRDPHWHDVYLLDLRTRALTLLLENDDAYADFTLDADLQVRLATKRLADGGSEVRRRVGASWLPLRRVAFGDTFSPLRVCGDDLYALSDSGANAARLVACDLSSDAETVLAADEVYDVGGVLFDPETGRPQLCHLLAERPVRVLLDDTLAADLARVDALGAGDVTLTSRDHADRYWIVTHVSDVAPTAYHLLDRESGTTRLLFVDRPALTGRPLAPMEPFSFTARDGLLVHGYLTYPVGVDRTALPAVLFVHGGPWHRDTWGLVPTAQWLANRGYLCVQVNFRGSTGYGKAFCNAGNKEWGGKMHLDLVDAVEHLGSQGVLDPARVGIMGASYGGYAALCGATFTPDVFACAIDVVGPSSIQTLIDSCPPYWVDVARSFRLRVADPDTEPELARERSPLHHVDNIRIPLLIAQGANDPRVKRSESDQIAAALAAKGIPHTYLVFEDEGHGFGRPENEERYRAAAEAFLGEHLGGRVSS